jgi:hypothetical protein
VVEDCLVHDANRWTREGILQAGVRQAGRLYLPSGSRYFGCRACHDLTYTSCRESHKRGSRLYSGLRRLRRLVDRVREQRERSERKGGERSG